MTSEEFWPYYLAQHLHPTNRALHFAGTTFGLACGLVSIFRGTFPYVPLAFAGAYGLAWIGHFGFERNSPATFRYPLLSFRSDFKMYALMWRGQCRAEIQRLAPKLAEIRKKTR